MSETVLVNGILDFKHRHKRLWDACLHVRPERSLKDLLVRLHRYYHEDSDYAFEHPALSDDLPRHLTWSGVDVLRICALSGLSKELEHTLELAELYEPHNLPNESPIRFLDESDFVDVLAEVAASKGVEDEAQIFTAAVFYLKTSCKSCSRRA